MNNVFAKVKNSKQKELFKLLSNTNLFDSINLNRISLVDYSPDHNLDEDSWFKIQNFSKEPYYLSYLTSEFDSKDFDELKKDSFNEIKYILGHQNGDFYFQKITPALYLQKKMIFFGEVAQVESTKTRLVLNTIPDAIYFTKRDVLVFRNLATISSIFNGIDSLYKEATDEEVEKFLKSDFINLKDEYIMEKVSKPNRKRISLIFDTLEGMSAQDKNNLKKYINSYLEDKLKFNKSQKNYDISSDEELKFLLYGIEQRFYTTPFSKEKRLANSVIKLK